MISILGPALLGRFSDAFLNEQGSQSFSIFSFGWFSPGSLITLTAFENLVSPGAYQNLFTAGARRNVIIPGAYHNLMILDAYQKLWPEKSQQGGQQDQKKR